MVRAGFLSVLRGQYAFYSLEKYPTVITAISPIDGRYANKTGDLIPYFSEYALIRYRVWVEVQYLVALADSGIPQLEHFPDEAKKMLYEMVEKFSLTDAERIKTIERTTNHDVKAVEYFIKEKLSLGGWEDFQEFVHFGLTSQDINNTAVPALVKDALSRVIIPELQKVVNEFSALERNWHDVPMLARTHGQPATPTTLDKEFAVFRVRLNEQIRQLKAVPMSAKFGGATGGFNAHYVAYPDRDWQAFGKEFVEKKLGLSRSFPTTQIEHYDNIAAFSHALVRINTILIDFCRDIWTYIMLEYFGQKTVKGEVGSSAMPHKVNPIDFENAEGNLGMANAILEHLAAKLPISRLQRDLTDSTVLRNLGVPVAHQVIAFKSICKGISKLQLQREKLAADLDANWLVVSEAIQTILRREGYPKPYEALKDLTRGKAEVGEKELHDFIEQLDVSSEVKKELLAVRPETFIGH